MRIRILGDALYVARQRVLKIKVCLGVHQMRTSHFFAPYTPSDDAKPML
ncbi:MAG: hypothetical protein HC764_02530 [Pleurocapsa sp. CRU_1_2]|nr:hypothetical protein [Pleurocapsa sp. CRU_1_2]